MKKSDIRKAKEMLAVTNNIQRAYVRELIRMRKNALNKALKLYDQTQNIDMLSFIDEPYLPTFFRQMYTVTANKVGSLLSSPIVYEFPVFLTPLTICNFRPFNIFMVIMSS